ncbi:MAG: type I methionyl aminopeptidase [Myxococcales bacterium]|nr:type I methionyl aminopeptidase [Myxococcales bacterium]
MIPIKSTDEIAKMRAAGAIVGDTLRMIRQMAVPGVRLRTINKAAEKAIRKRGATPTFKGYHGFPAALCMSVNEQVVHGLPSWRKLKSGDLLSVDCGATLDGFIGDAAITIAVGEIDDAADRLLRATRQALLAGLAVTQPGHTLGDIGAAITGVGEAAGLGVVTQYCGHGIGRQMHQDPQVPNHGDPSTGPVLLAGWCLALEPMLTEGAANLRTLSDGWTVATADGGRAAHFEMSVALNDSGGQLLTLTSDGKWP